MSYCSWGKDSKNKDMIKYHDEEWGIPIYDDKKHFEFLMLEVMQCGLNWNMETTLTRVSMFSGTMAGVGNEEEAHEKIRDFINSWGIREFYLCIDPSICRETETTNSHESYPDKMLLLYGVRNGKPYGFEIVPKYDLIPGLQQIRKNAVCLVFCPLYYRNQSLDMLLWTLGKAPIPHCTPF